MPRILGLLREVALEMTVHGCKRRMGVFFAILVVGALGAGPGTASADDVVQLITGDRITGKLTQISADGLVRMTNQFFTKPVDIRVAGVRRIILGAGQWIADGPDSLSLTNGNRILGEIQEITPDSITVMTKSMGQVKVKRSVISRVSFKPRGNAFLASDFSSGSSAPWQLRSSMKLEDGKLRCTSSSGWASAKVKQGGAMTFEWTVSGLTSSYAGGIVIFAKNNSNYYGGDGIYFKPRSNYLRIYRVRSNSLSSVMSKSFGQTFSTATFRASYDPESGRLRVWVNEMDLGTYTINPIIKTGEYVHLYSQSTCAYETVYATMGAMTTSPDLKPTDKAGFIVLANSDKLSGTFSTLKDGVAVIKTAYGTLEIKKDRLLCVLFSTKGREVPRLRKGESTLYFRGGSAITAIVKKVSPEAIEANTEYAGDLKIKRDAVREIRFKR